MPTPDEYGRIYYSFDDVRLRNQPDFALGNDKHKLDRLSTDQWKLAGATGGTWGQDLKKERIILRATTDRFETNGRTVANVFTHCKGKIRFQYSEMVRRWNKWNGVLSDVFDDATFEGSFRASDANDMFSFAEFSMMPRMFLDIRLVAEWAGVGGHVDSEAADSRFFDEDFGNHAPMVRIDLRKWAESVGGFKETDGDFADPTAVLAQTSDFPMFGQWKQRELNLNLLNPAVANTTNLLSTVVGVEFVVWMYEMESVFTPDIWQREVDGELVNHEVNSIALRAPNGERVELPFAGIEVDLQFDGHIVLA